METTKDKIEKLVEKLKYHIEDAYDEISYAQNILSDLEDEIYEIEVVEGEKHFEINTLYDEQKLQVVQELYKNCTLEELNKLMQTIKK